MAKADLKNFQDLLTSDAEFQEKFKAAAEAYKGPQDEKAIFENLLLPLGQEHGLSATYEEFKEYTSSFADGSGELSEDELSQVAGGKDSGKAICAILGAGALFGTHSSKHAAYACQVIGVATFCMGIGKG